MDPKGVNDLVGPPLRFQEPAFFIHGKRAILDLVCSYHGFQDAGYREFEYERRNRINLNLFIPE